MYLVLSLTATVVWGVLPGSVVLTVMGVTRDGGHRAVDARISSAAARSMGRAEPDTHGSVSRAEVLYQETSFVSVPALPESLELGPR